jgi:pimeloyl-ACP methyl ester carboxylesterase
MRLHHEVVGEGLPLLLLPGAAADGSAWRHAGFVDALADAFTCVLIDPPGMGQSPWPDADDGFAAGAIARAVLDIADGLGADRFAVWGSSAGSAPAIVIAAEQPERVEALILSGAWPDDRTLWREWQFELAGVVRGLGGRGLIHKVYADEGVVLPAWAAELDPDGEAIARILEGTLDYPWAERAMPSMLRTPTLMILGTLEDPDGEAEQVAASMTDAEAAYLEGVGHVGAWPESAAASVAHVRRFVGARLGWSDV